MRSYRLFVLDRNGHIQGSHEFEALHDEAAIEISENWREGRTMELWELERRVRTWD